MSGRAGGARMAGTGWKAAGTILIVLGAVGVFVAVAGATFGGIVANDAASDAGRNCGSALFPRPCDENAGERMEAAGMIAVLAGLLGGVGLLFLVVGVA